MNDHYIIAKILELHLELTRDGKEAVFVWVPGHVVFRGNSAADSADKDALDGDIPDELIPFSDLKPHVIKYLLELCNPSGTRTLTTNRLISFLNLNDYCSCPRSNTREEIVIPRLHIGHSC